MSKLSKEKAMTLLKDFKKHVLEQITESKQTKISDIENQDGNFLTADAVNINILEKAKQYLNDKLSDKISFTVIPVDSLPSLEEAKEKIVYAVPSNDQTTDNLYDEYILINGKWETVGKEKIDLSKYNTSDQINEKVKAIEESNTEMTDDDVNDIISELWDRQDTYKYEVVLSDDESSIMFSKSPEYVDWGDGSKEISDHHIYSKAGTYIVQSTLPIIGGQDTITKVLRIPEGVTDGSDMFKKYTKLTTVAKFPSTLTKCIRMFMDCTSLVKVPEIPAGADCTAMFMNTGLTTAPAIPDSVLKCSAMFANCDSLTDISAIYSYIENHYSDRKYELDGMLNESENITIPDTAANIKTKYPNLF